MFGEPKKLIEAYTLSHDNKEQDIAKGCALIRANFNVNPGTLTPEEWASLFGEAVWLENFRLENLAKIIAKLFETPQE